MISHSQIRVARVLLLFTRLPAFVAVYVPGLYGGFLFDDFPNIVGNPALRAIVGGKPDWLSVLTAFRSRRAAPADNVLSFGLNIYAFGMNPVRVQGREPLHTHLCNGSHFSPLDAALPHGFAAGTHNHVRPEFLAVLVAGLWLLHPLNVSGVLYIVQRMNQLSVTLFTLLGLLCYVEGRLSILRGEPGLLKPSRGFAYSVC